jgi:hypothetical protein
MRAKLITSSAGLALCLACASAAELPLSRVVLFSSGVGYFERSGHVEGDATVELSFRTDQINDLLKSLVLLDQGGGTIGPVTYAPRNPLEHTLSSFSVDIAGNPSLRGFAESLRGTRVSVVSQSGPVEGVIFGTETQEKSVGQNVVHFDVINILTDKGLVEVPVWQLKSLKLDDAKVNEDLNKALDAIAASRNVDKRPVTLLFQGKEKRPVQVGYIVETPVWKTTYRLIVENGKSLFLQGWAIVENTTDDDWDQVSLALVAGQPISFTQDLYEPLYVTRPEVPPQVMAPTAAPQVYGRALEEGVRKAAAAEVPAEEKAARPSRAAERRALAAAPALPPAAYEPSNALIVTGRGGGYGGFGGGGYGGGGLAVAGAAAMAAGEQVGELFQYAVERPVTIPRQQSAMIPIVSQTIEGQKVSVYRESVNAKFPLNGLKLKNTSGLYLMRGPITVFDGKAYAGDALITDIAPGEDRLITYAVDLDIEVESRREQSAQELVALKIARGVLLMTRKQRSEVTYNVKNVSDEPRTLIIEHPLRQGWNLVEPAEPEERTREVYRFAVDVKPKDTAKLTVVEERTDSETAVLTDLDVDRIVILIKAPKISDAVKQALQEIVTRKTAIGDLRKQRQERQARLEEINKEQERIRKNMEQLDHNSELYQMYVKKLTDQEKEFEQLQGEIKEIQAKEDTQQKDLDQFILNLNVE